MYWRNGRREQKVRVDHHRELFRRNGLTNATGCTKILDERFGYNYVANNGRASGSYERGGCVKQAEHREFKKEVLEGFTFCIATVVT